VTKCSASRHHYGRYSEAIAYLAEKGYDPQWGQTSKTGHSKDILNELSKKFYLEK
jgi:aspartyl/asparaginyl-tRNA synthetase